MKVNRIQKRFAALLLILHCSMATAEPSLRVAVISDINGRYGSTGYAERVATAVRKIIELAPDAVISTGDMVAGQRAAPPLGRQALEAMWHSFQRTVDQPLRFAGIPLLMTPGNHDASAYPGFEHERIMYADYHRANPPLLQPDSGGNFPFYFTSTLGSLRLVSLDATRVGTLDPIQRDWLRQTLQQSDASHTLVFGHLPLQPIARGREGDIISDPQLERILQQAGVTAYLSGHHHAYYPGQRVGVKMLSVGNLGGNQRALVGTGQRTGFSFVMLDLTVDGGMTVTAYQGPDFTGVVNVRELPATIGRGDQQLTRHDLVGNRSVTADTND